MTSTQSFSSKPTCTRILPSGKTCGSDKLQQGTNGKILCGECKGFLILVPPETIGI